MQKHNNGVNLKYRFEMQKCIRYANSGDGHCKKWCCAVDKGCKGMSRAYVLD